MKKNYFITALYSRKIIFLLISLISSFTIVRGQIPQTAFELTKTNKLYVGLDNSLNIVSLNKFDSISFSNGIVEPNKFLPTQSMSFIITPEFVDEYGDGLVTIYRNNKPLDSMHFRSLMTPIPTVKIAGINQGFLQKEILRIQRMLSATLDNFDFDIRFKVHSFQMVTSLNGQQKTLTSNSYQFTGEQKAIFNQLSSGDTLLFNNVYIDGPGGIRLAQPAKFIIE